MSKINLSLVLAVSNQNVYGYKILKGAISQTDFIEFNSCILNIIPEKMFVLYYDKAQTHLSNKTKFYFQDKVPVLIAPTTTPELSIVNYCFGFIRSQLSKKYIETEQELISAIDSSIEKILYGFYIQKNRLCIKVFKKMNFKDKEIYD